MASLKTTGVYRVYIGPKEYPDFKCLPHLSKRVAEIVVSQHPVVYVCGPRGACQFIREVASKGATEVFSDSF